MVFVCFLSVILASAFYKYAIGREEATTADDEIPMSDLRTMSHSSTDENDASDDDELLVL